MTGHAGFKDRTRLAAARERLLDAVEPVDGTDRVSVAEADGRVLAGAVTPRRPVPHYERAAMDGYAVVAESTFGSSEHSPAVLDVAEQESDPAETPAVDRRTAVRVHTGSELPAGADAVVMVEATETFGDEVEVRESVTVGENVAPVGEDVPGDAELYGDGHRLRPSDLGLLRSVGVDAVEAYEPPTVDVIPTGDELVDADPDPGEVVETNALAVSRYVERWGGTATYRDVVPDDRAALRAAVERGLTADLVVTTGGSSVGERDLIADVVGDRGTVLEHGLAIKPGHPVGFGVVEDTPVLMLPGYPVSCIVTAVQLLRPALKRAGHLPVPEHPRTTATLDRKLASEPGVRTFARVSLDPGADTDPGADANATAGRAEAAADADAAAERAERRAVPVRTGGAGVLSSVTDADGWVTVPESVEGVDAGERVVVEDWEYRP
ncbi:molybdopterin molybdotransferase MoeA [Halorubellus sp. JP-L1]|uniref:molybdopterin molybdotransferase MoeA n=1 Tax=Halorubellus sp. JP-L1 TaxID=2715753 RepID=UPI0014079189|nr:molybdopterin molybdotransferase MoeA [Halorubellus sp. JP-L1]NHN42778.1 molybdopterin molybdotransferase MoeA [Halorubellus sp. JP-L1]